MSISANANFEKEIARFILKSKGAIQAVCREVLKEIGFRLVMRSPVGDPMLWKQHRWPKGYIPGHFINNWQLSMDSIVSTEIPGEDPSGALAIARMNKAIPRWPVGHSFFFVNNSPYALLLETGTLSWQCGPGGMVGLTVAEFPQIIRQAELSYIREH